MSGYSWLSDATADFQLDVTGCPKRFHVVATRIFGSPSRLLPNAELGTLVGLRHCRQAMLSMYREETVNECSFVSTSLQQWIETREREP